MLPLWQLRPYRKFTDAKFNFCNLTGLLEAVSKKARSKAQGVRWIDVLEMVKAAPCRKSEVQKPQVPIDINGKAFTLELDIAASEFHFYSRLDRVGHAETSTGSVALPFGK